MHTSSFFLKIFTISASIIVLLMNTQKKEVTKNKDILDVFSWPEYFESKELIETFEKKHNCKVRIHEYTSNEELLAKLKSDAHTPYDIIMPSGYAVKELIKQDILSPLDYSKITTKLDILPFLLNKHFDKKNVYSLPNTWEVYGFTATKDFFSKNPSPTYATLFDFTKDTMIAMVQDPVEAVFLAGSHLFGSVKKISNTQLSQVIALLKDQKKNVAAYTDYRARFLIQSGNCDLAISSSGIAWYALRENSSLSFQVPQDASIISIENIAIPRSAKNKNLAYEFINHLYVPENNSYLVGDITVYPVVCGSIDYVKNQPEEYYTVFENTQKKNPTLFSMLSDEVSIRLGWMDVKSL